VVGYQVHHQMEEVQSRASLEATGCHHRESSCSNSVGTLKDGYVRNVPLPRVPREQRASPELTAPKDRIQLPVYSLLPSWIPTLPKLGNVLGFSQRLLWPFFPRHRHNR
jgi:hypothetical protein